MPYTLPPLPYEYGALEPYIDARTMELHHGAHHAGYVTKLNDALKNYPDLDGKPLNQLLRNLDAVPEVVRTAVRNQGGGHYNHSLFWKMMSKKGGAPHGSSAQAITKKFGAFETMQQEFTAKALSVFGSGWAWLCLNTAGELVIITTANQDAPISTGHEPILGLDVWEHAYYLAYQNKRGSYIDAWWQVVNWEQVEENYTTLVR